MPAMPQTAPKTLPVARARRLPYPALARRAFAGEALLFAGANAGLVAAARKLCRRVFATPAPARAHLLYNKDEFFNRAGAAQQEFNTAPYKALFADWLRGVGIDPAPLYWDMLGLRIAPPVATHSGGWRSHIGAHRDTWGAGIQSQINWWAPLWPLARGRTMAFFLDYWQKPLANSTANWSFEAYLAERKKTPPGRAVAYPSAPRALAQPNAPPSLVNMACGELLAFSSAHLHASVPNNTALTRFSLEIRTFSEADIGKPTGAPNVDCESSPPLWRLFRGATDNRKPPVAA